jgi:hypothetical protein
MLKVILVFTVFNVLFYHYKLVRQTLRPVGTSIGIVSKIVQVWPQVKEIWNKNQQNPSSENPEKNPIVD